MQSISYIVETETLKKKVVTFSVQDREYVSEKGI